MGELIPFPRPEPQREPGGPFDGVVHETADGAVVGAMVITRYGPTMRLGPDGWERSYSCNAQAPDGTACWLPENHEGAHSWT